MNKDELFKELLHAMQDLASFVPYVYDGMGVTESMIRSKMRFVGETLIRAANDGQDEVKE